MKIGGLVKAMADIFMTAKQTPMKWGITAVEKDKLRKPGKASPGKKKQRKEVNASRRRNRG
jgi:hypothetical protein